MEAKKRDTREGSAIALRGATEEGLRDIKVQKVSRREGVG